MKKKTFTKAKTVVGYRMLSEKDNPTPNSKNASKAIKESSAKIKKADANNLKSLNKDNKKQESNIVNELHVYEHGDPPSIILDWCRKILNYFNKK